MGYHDHKNILSHIITCCSLIPNLINIISDRNLADLCGTIKDNFNINTKYVGNKCCHVHNILASVNFTNISRKQFGRFKYIKYINIVCFVCKNEDSK